GNLLPRPLYRSNLTRKYVMAVTGMILMAFVLAHMIGNLKLYLGAGALARYAAWLRTGGEPALPRETLLWIVRIVLLGALVLHLEAAYTLTMVNRRARPQPYRTKRDYIAADFA